MVTAGIESIRFEVTTFYKNIVGKYLVKTFSIFQS